MNKNTKNDFFVSAIVICDSQSSISGHYLDELIGLLSPNFKHYEILIVDNGLHPAKHAEVISELSSRAGVRMLSLTKEFSVDAAIFAGLEACIGERILLLIPETDHPTQIDNLVSVLTNNSVDVAQWMNDKQEKSSGFLSVGRSLFFAFNRSFLDIDMSSKTTYLTVLSRRAVLALTDISRTQRYFKHLIAHIGFPVETYRYSPLISNKKHQSLRLSVSRAIEMVSSYSTKPLRMMTTIGLCSALASVFYAVYVIVVQFTKTNVVEGWTTTSLQISLMFFVVSLVLAVQSEYIGRILTESRKEPIYILKEEIESDIPVPGLEQGNVKRE